MTEWNFNISPSEEAPKFQSNFPCSVREPISEGDMMEVLLVDADSKKGFPNLALMKLSTWYKQQGHTIDLIKGIPTTKPLEQYDKVLISCIFYQNREQVLDYASQFDNVQIGGSGFDYNIVLDQDIEHIMPDYSLYNLDYSIGFTSRGCIRNCGFCVVPEKEGFIRDNAPISEFHYPEHKKIILLDNNFQASPKWRENIEYLIEHDLKVNFNQGLDIRILDYDFASQLAQTKYYNWTFKRKGLHFAFDDLRYEKQIWAGIDLLENVGVNLKDVLFYVLIGYNTTEEEDLYRINSLYERGVRPYVMPYNQCKSKLTRWVNRLYYQFIPWSEYNK